MLTGSATEFPATIVGASSQETLTVTATEPLTVSSLESSSSQFTLGTPSLPLPAKLSTGQTIEVPITFQPSATGPLAATLTATTSSGKKATFALSGTGQDQTAQLEVAQPVVTFGGTSVGESLSDTATFRNVGGSPLEIEEVELPSAPFFVEDAPSSGDVIPPGGSITVTIDFDPTVTGKFEQRIGLDTSGGNGEAHLTGSAGAPGALQVADETVEYGNVLVGQSASGTFTLTNTCGTTVTITKSKPPVGGEFTATTSLPEGTTILPGESVTEGVMFSPTAIGATSAVWPINGTDTTGLHEVRFSGTGTLLAQPSPVALTSLPQSTATALLGVLPAKESAPPSVAPDAKLASVALTANARGAISVRVSCPAGGSSCTGTITLRTLTAMRRAGATHAKPTILTLANGSFKVSAGHVTAVKLHLSSRGRALLAHLHVLRARATVVVSAPAGATSSARSIVTIRAAGLLHGR
jgi:hypothetical protein